MLKVKAEKIPGFIELRAKCPYCSTENQLEYDPYQGKFVQAKNVCWHYMSVGWNSEMRHYWLKFKGDQKCT